MRNLFRIFLLLGALAVIGVLVWQGVTAAGAPERIVADGRVGGRS